MSDTDDVKMVTIRWKLSIGYSGANREDEFEIEEGATDEEIDELVAEATQGYIESSWKKEAK